MKLADFFVGSRQLFGFLAPGVVWVTVLYLPFGSVKLGVIIANASFLEVVLALAASLIVGTALESIAFGFSVRVSAALRKESISREENDSDYLPLSVPEGLIARSRRIASEKAFLSEYVNSLTDRQFSQYCKYDVLERQEKYRDRLVEYEAEINLLAMLPLPLFLLANVVMIWGLGGDAPPGYLHLPTAFFSV